MFTREPLSSSKTAELKEFDKIFLNTVEEGLRCVLGETSAKLIFLRLEMNKELGKGEIPQNIEEFSSGLTELMGPSAPFLEMLVGKLLCSKLELEYEAKPEFKFTDHVEKLRKGFEE